MAAGPVAHCCCFQEGRGRLSFLGCYDSIALKTQTALVIPVKESGRTHNQFSTGVAICLRFGAALHQGVSLRLNLSGEILGPPRPGLIPSCWKGSPWAQKNHRSKIFKTHPSSQNDALALPAQACPNCARIGKEPLDRTCAKHASKRESFYGPLTKKHETFDRRATNSHRILRGTNTSTTLLPATWQSLFLRPKDLHSQVPCLLVGGHVQLAMTQTLATLDV